MPDNTRPWTRDDIVNRAYEWEPKVGYIYGGNCGYNGGWKYTACGPNEGDQSYYVNSSQYVAADCSSFASWCWNMSFRADSKWFKAHNYHPKTGSGSSATAFAGIQKGDILWKEGHVAVYVGNNTFVEAYTSFWNGSWSGHGTRIGTLGVTRSDFQGYSSWDNSDSVDYDEDDPEKDPWDGSPPIDPTPNEGEPGTGDVDEIVLIADNMYTKRYHNMKNWRYY